MFPIEELKRRVESFQAILRDHEVDGALFIQRADTIYFSGTGQNLHVYIPAEGKPVFMAFRDIVRAQEESPWEIIPLKGLSKIPSILSELKIMPPKVLGLEYDVLPVAQFERYRKIFSEVKFVDISYQVRLLRAIKSHWEIAKIEETGKIYAALHEYAPTILRPGMTEIEFEGLIELKARTLGHETMVRVRGFGSEFHLGAVFSGPRGAQPSYFDGPLGGLGASFAHPLGASRTPIQAGEPIIMDLALACNGYQIDTTRVFVLGELDDESRSIYQTSLIVEEKIRQALVPGRAAGEVYDEILDFVNTETPYSEYFMGYGATQCRFVGHGVGLELDELPTISKNAKEILKPGMVISIEPKFAIPEKVGIGIEDTLVIEGAQGARYLCPVSREIVRV